MSAVLFSTTGGGGGGGGGGFLLACKDFGGEVGRIIPDCTLFFFFFFWVGGDQVARTHFHFVAGPAQSGSASCGGTFPDKLRVTSFP